MRALSSAHFSAGCFLGLALALSRSVSAQDFKPLLLDAVSRVSAVAVPESLILERIRVSGKNPTEYFSLGETHLFTPLSRPYYQALAREYFTSASAPIHTCAEDLSVPIESIPLYVSLRDSSASFWLSPGNTPRNTDFRRCDDPAKKWFTYSGLFHQYPLPRMFPGDFAQTPVALETGNTIVSQMRRQRGLFIGGLDLVYVENQATLTTIQESRDPQAFRARVNSLKNSVSALRVKMEPLSLAPTPGRLRGAFFGKGSFVSVLGLEAMPDQAFVLILEPSYRFESEASLSMLTSLAATDESWLSGLFARLHEPGVSFQFAGMMDFLDPVLLSPVPFRFGVIPETLPPGTEILQFSQGENQYGITASPASSDLRCYAGRRGRAAKRVPCQEL